MGLLRCALIAFIGFLSLNALCGPSGLPRGVGLAARFVAESYSMGRFSSLQFVCLAYLFGLFSRLSVLDLPGLSGKSRLSRTDDVYSRGLLSLTSQLIRAIILFIVR